MPLEFLRFPPTGPRDARDTARTCNNLGEATARQIAAIEARLDLIEAILPDMRVAAQGAMSLAVGVAGPDITGAFQTITFFDTIPYERGVTVNTTTGEFTFNLAGDWVFLYRANVSHNNSGATRTVDVRLFDVTGGTPSTAEQVFIPSNQPTTPLNAMVPFDLLQVDVGDTFRLEIGNASANLTGVNWDSSSLLLLYLNELGGLIDPYT